jgi:chromosome segregation ATPase
MATKTPAQHKEQIRELDTIYQIALREVTNSFPYAKAYPTLTAYTDAYNNNQTNINELNKDIFLEKDSLQMDIQTVGSEVEDIISKIAAVENKNAKLMIQLQSLDNDREGAIGMYDDSKYWYKFYFGVNATYFIAICALGYGIYKNILTTE